MNPDKQATADQKPLIEDLSVNEGRAGEVKGGRVSGVGELQECLITKHNPV